MANKKRNKIKKVGVDFKDKNIIDVNLLALMLLATLVWWFNYYLNFQGFNALTSDAISYANMASNFLNGEGFTLNFTLPVEASLLKREYIFPIPSSRYPYIHPFIIAMLFKVFGEGSFAMVLSSGLAYILMVGAAYVLAKKIFNKKVAIFSTLFVIFNNDILVSSVSGLTEPLFMFFFFLSIYFLMSDGNKKNLAYAAVFFGLAQSTRFVGVVFTLPLLMFVFLGEDSQKVKRTLFFFVISTLVALPVYISNLSNYGGILGSMPKYYFLYGLLAEFPHHQPIKYLAGMIEPNKLLLENFDLFTSKIFTALIVQIKDVISGKFIAIPFIFLPIISLFTLKVNLKIKLLLGLIFVLMGLQFMINSATFVLYRYFQPFIPILVMFSIALIFELMKRYDKKVRYGLIVLTLAMFVIIFPFKSSDNSFASSKAIRNNTESWLYELRGFIQTNVEEGKIIVSDVPWLMGFYGKRYSIWLPATIDVFNKMEKDLFKADYIFLSPHYTLRAYENKHWQSLYLRPHKWNDYVPYKMFKYQAYKAILYKRSN